MMTRPAPFAAAVLLGAAALVGAQEEPEGAPRAPDPEASRAAYAEGAAAYREERWGDAIAAHRRALALWDENARALNDLAWILLTAEDEGLRRPEEALALAERAVALDGRENDAYLDTLATAYDRAGRHLEAARLELVAIRREAQAFYGEQLAAFARRAAESLAGAPEADAALRHEVAGLEAWGGVVRARAAEGDAARARWEEALAAATAETAAADPRAAAARGLALAGLGRWAEAEPALAAALEHGAERFAARLWARRADALERLDRRGEAAAALAEAVRRRPGAHGLHRRLADLWRRLGDPDRTQAAVDRAVAALEAHPPLWGTKSAHRLHLLAARAQEAALERARADLAPEAPDPPEAAARRRALRDALVRAAAVRAGDAKLDGRIAALTSAVRGAPPGPLPALRARLAAEVLGQAPPPRFRDATGERFGGEVGGRRVAFADVDGDGDPDLLTGGSRLLLNDGAGRFEAAGDVGLRGGVSGGVFADFDRDGDLDLYAAGRGRAADRLYRNVSGPDGVRFEDVTDAVGVAGGVTDDHPSEGVGWGDLNGDGYPDLYVANYERPGQPLARPTPDRLYLSDGRGGLRDASELLRQEPDQCGRGVSVADFDQDGDADVFVSNYRLDRDFLWVSDGAGGLADEAIARGVAGERVRDAYGHTIGAAWGDLDRDGDLDLVAARLAHPRFIGFSDASRVYLQGDDGRFTDVREAVGIRFEETHSNPTLFDADDDGDLDLLLTCVYGGRPTYLWRNLLTETGELRFEDVTWGAGVRLWNGWGSAAADVDGDGDFDLAVSARGGVRLLLNEGAPGAARRSVRVRLVGTRSDTWGAGATAVLTGPGGPPLVEQVRLGEGTTCQSEPILHFGLGERAGPFRLEVRWPAGARTVAFVGTGRHTLYEPE